MVPDPRRGFVIALTKIFEPYFTGKEKSIAFRSKFDMENPSIRDAVRTDIRRSTSSPIGHAEDITRSRKEYKVHFKLNPKKMVKKTAPMSVVIMAAIMASTIDIPDSSSSRLPP